MEDDDIAEGQFEGIFYRSTCPYCDDENETEDDIRGQVVDCDSCGEPYRAAGN